MKKIYYNLPCLGMLLILLSVLISAQSSYGQVERKTPGITAPRTTTFDFCCPTILSETIAMEPIIRTRKTIAVGEEVTLKLDTEEAVTWTITTGGGTLNMSFGNEVTFTAPVFGGETTITASSTDPGCAPTVTFTIVEPLRIGSYCVELSNEITTFCFHQEFIPSGGMILDLFVVPKDVPKGAVSFYNIEFQEQEVLSSNIDVEGVWALQNENHEQGMFVLGTTEVHASKGTFLANDLVAFGFVNPPPNSATATGSQEISIPVHYRINGTSEVIEGVVSNSTQGILSEPDLDNPGGFVDVVYKGIDKLPQAVYFREQIFGAPPPSGQDFTTNNFVNCTADDLHFCEE